MALATTYVPSLLLCVAHTRFRGSKRSELVIRRGNLKQTSGCQQERDCKESELQEDESMNVDQKMNHETDWWTISALHWAYMDSSLNKP
ncbi:hypothetical protein NC653_005327 [Populus alba x Populus x berolinensis]|uniref:Uncharacterized protein n=1 Tax=Populus alba x Populus x berolinensis TaxID=444605 RepID=A0AAD6RCM2_9ROSI|nr:hypothetical protein NC653_005327 [Populus alba x Populus x berolinensis]